MVVTVARHPQVFLAVRRRWRESRGQSLLPIELWAQAGQRMLYRDWIRGRMSHSLVSQAACRQPDCCGARQPACKLRVGFDLRQASLRRIGALTRSVGSRTSSSAERRGASRGEPASIRKRTLELDLKLAVIDLGGPINANVKTAIEQACSSATLPAATPRPTAEHTGDRRRAPITNDDRD